MSSRRQTLGVLPSTSNRPSEAASSRKSLGGKFARQSLAPNTSRQSIAGNARNSIGARNAAVDRKSGGGRRSSMGVASSSRGVRVDPRPITDKNYVKENIRKLILFLTSHHYNQQLSPKQLSSPSTKDFKNIILFLFQQLDPNFQFGANFEDQVKMYLKRFGYPFAISKNALQAAGSPHTWPYLLAMLVWLMEELQYHEAVHLTQPLNADPMASIMNITPQQVAQESEQQMFFEYVSGAYQAFLQGEDNFSVFDEALAKKFDLKNAGVSEEIDKLNARSEELQQEIAQLQAAKDSLDEYNAFKKACQADIPVLEENIRNNRAYLESVQTKKVAREQELENKIKQLEELEVEKAKLTEQLSKQTFTPLQVSEMMHQKATLESTLEAQAKAAENIQNEIWNKEMEIVKKITAIEKLTHDFNDLDLSISNASSKSSHPHQHMDLQFNSNASTASTMLSLDLKAHKDALTLVKESLAASKRELTSEKSKQNERIQTLQQLKAEHETNLESLSKRAQKVADLYATERATMNKAVEASCAQVEDVELELVSLRNALSASSSTKVSPQVLASLDAEIARTDAACMHEQAALKGDICSMMQELTEHKVSITERLEMLLAQADKLKANIANAEITMNQDIEAKNQ